MTVLAVAVEEVCRVDVVDVVAEAEVDVKHQHTTTITTATTVTINTQPQ